MLKLTLYIRKESTSDATQNILVLPQSIEKPTTMKSHIAFVAFRKANKEEKTHFYASGY